MPFDLPRGARSPSSPAAWGSALAARDFQDKLLRVVQYGSRGAADVLLRRDAKHGIGLKLFALYGQLSLSRKAFRALRWVADARLAVESLREALREGASGQPVTRCLTALHWLLMAAHIFWDNMFFCTHRSVRLVDLHSSKRWTNAACNQAQKNWRAAADLAGLAAAWLRARLARQSLASKEAGAAWLQRRVGTLAVATASVAVDGSATGTAARLGGDVADLAAGAVGDGTGAAGAVAGDDWDWDDAGTGAAGAVAVARDELREAKYALAKLAADVATYLPQTDIAQALAAWLAWRDAHVGVAGCVAALLSCRAEWLKL